MKLFELLSLLLFAQLSCKRNHFSESDKSHQH